jgi:amidase
VRSLSELIAFNNENAEVEQALFGQDIFENSLAAPGIESEEYQTALMLVRKATRDEGIDALLSEYDVKVLVGPSGPISSRVDVANGDVWPPWAGAGSMAAVSGYPNLTVPMGTIAGVPVGVSFMSGRGEDLLILSVGLAFENTGSGSPEPHYKSTIKAEDMRAL